MRTISKLLGVFAVVLIAVGAAGYWYYFIRDDAPGVASLPSRTTVATQAGIDGTWRVVDGNGVFAGFRIEEEMTGGIGTRTAVMRTAHTTGTLSIAGTQVTAATVTADLTQLENKDAQPPGIPGLEHRQQRLQDEGLEIARFPEATFTLGAPLQLPHAPARGERIRVQAAGTLTLHGVTRHVTIPLAASWNGAIIDVTGRLTIKLADYSISAPSAFFVHVGDRGTLEFQLVFKASK